MQQNFLVEGQSLTVEWVSQKPLRLRLGEELVSVRYHRPGFCLLEDGRCLRYTASAVAGSWQWQIDWQGQPLQAQWLRAQDRKQGGMGGQGGLVKSPMNGAVVKVECGMGDSVEAGQVVLVLEAMKMENEVAAPLTGKLARLEVKVGQVVAANEVLFEVCPPE